jgi:hypothetical protein
MRFALQSCAAPLAMSQTSPMPLVLQSTWVGFAIVGQLSVLLTEYPAGAVDEQNVALVDEPKVSPSLST